MKKIKTFTILSFLGCFTAQAQNFAPQSVAHNPHKCATDEVHQEMMQKDNTYKQNILNFDKEYLKQLALRTNVAQNTQVGATYIIPVVVHVMHKGEALGVGTNISEDAIRTKIRIINEEFRKVAGSYGDGNGVDMGIEFALAVRNPSGSCTNGINRINMSSNSTYMTYGIKRSGANGMIDTDLKALSYWPSNQYYNIWLVSEIDNNEGGSGIQGYAYFASAHGQTYDGALILSNSFKSPTSRTETHELGHALNLYHTFEGDGGGGTCPTGNQCGTGLGDCCADIPPHKRSASDCLTTGTNSCNANSSNSLFVNNYMDYSSDACQNMFTANQKTRAQAAVSGTRSSFLAANGNNKLVPPAAPTANYIQSAQVVCVGQSIKMYDNSTCIPNTFLNENNWSGITFNWSITNGATTLTSTLQNPTFTFTQQGNYTITYTVTNAIGTNTKTVTNGIYVKAAPVAACIPSSQNVGNYAYTVNNVSFNTINNPTSTSANAGYTNNTCSINTVVIAGQTYPLSVGLRANTSNAEQCQVYIDYNNNGTWETSERVLNSSIAAGTTTSVSASVLIPTTAIQNTLLRMRVIGEAGTLSSSEINCSTSLYVGDVEDYGVYITSALGSDEFTFANLNYYPNPTENILYINNSTPIETVELYSIVGQKLLSKNVNAANTIVDITNYPQGTYFVTVYANNQKNTFKIIRK